MAAWRRERRLDAFGATPRERLEAGRAWAATGTPRRRAGDREPGSAWPARSPGARNAWVVLLASKAPSWEDPLLPWRESPPSLGEPHPGFFYPDPLGYLEEVRRWITTLVQVVEPGWRSPEALSVAALAHVGQRQSAVEVVVSACRPRVVLALDDAAWQLAGHSPREAESHHVPDPHRAGKVYQGLWGRLDDGTVVGKAPQHPAAHRFYREHDIDGYLRAMPDPGSLPAG